ncbi:hypothetical protein BaRGS_00011023 [Batillaria attramentaria]|uniref:C2H2-type domain-containing protein n=1 Tax=Batillaria attramentaria TaxID=370345 RepID=A0ABD0LEJ2_9CAEN
MSSPPPRDLIMHRLVMHNSISPRLQSELVSSSSVLASLTSGKNGISRLLETSTPGFSDLDFLDFTTDKFSLAAKAWCREEPAEAEFPVPQFLLQEMQLAVFPAMSSLQLHAASHKPHNWTRCPLCDCYFVSSDLLHTHMHKHIADKAMVESLLHG